MSTVSLQNHFFSPIVAAEAKDRLLAEKLQEVREITSFIMRSTGDQVRRVLVGKREVIEVPFPCTTLMDQLRAAFAKLLGEGRVLQKTDVAAGVLSGDREVLAVLHCAELLGPDWEPWVRDVEASAEQEASDVLVTFRKIFEVEGQTGVPFKVGDGSVCEFNPNARFPIGQCIDHAREAYQRANPGAEAFHSRDAAWIADLVLQHYPELRDLRKDRKPIEVLLTAIVHFVLFPEP